MCSVCIPRIVSPHKGPCLNSQEGLSLPHHHGRLLLSNYRSDTEFAEKSPHTTDVLCDLPLSLLCCDCAERFVVKAICFGSPLYSFFLRASRPRDKSPP